jgi:hypothetical protein
MTDKEFKILQSTLCADIAETETQVLGIRTETFSLLLQLL